MDTILVKDVKNRVTVNVAEKGATGPAGPSSNYTLPPATNTTLGGIIVGDNLSITGNGVLSAQPGGVTAFNNRTGNVSLTANDVNTALTYTPLASTNPYGNLSFTGTSADNPFNFKIQNSNGSRSVGITSGGNNYVYGNGTVVPWGSYLDFNWSINNPRANGQVDTYYPFFRLFTDRSFPDINEAGLGLYYNYTPNATTGPYYNSSLRVYKTKLEFYASSYTWTDNSVLTRFYADTRYLTSANLTPYLTTLTAAATYLPLANLTFANLTGTPTTLAGYGITNGLTASNLTTYLTISSANSTYSVLGHTHAIANVTGLQTALDAKLESANFTYSNLTGKPSTFAPSAHTHAISEVTGLQTALDAKLPSANFTYANISGTPDLTAYVKKTQNTTQTIASTATVGGDSSTLTLNSSSYAMSVSTLAGISNLTVTPTSATLVLAGNGTWTANSILTMGYADGRYLTSANLTYANITGKPTLANVATSGSYTDLSNTPTAYSLPTATNTTLGGIKVGANLSISNGVLSAISSGSSATSLPWSNITSTPTTLAGYGITDGLTASNLTAYLTSTTAASTYLPIANFTYANITGKPTLATVATTGSYTDLSNTPASYSLPTASTTVLGGVKVDGTTIAISSGVISAVSSSYTLPMASASTLGGVRIGSGISVDQGNGFLNTDVRLTTNTFTGTQNLGGNLLTQPKLQAYRETSTAPTISAGSLTLDLSGSNFFAVSLNAAISTITISNIPSSSVSSFTLEFTGTGTTYSVNWTLSSGVIKWAGAAAAPTITATSGKKDVFCFYTTDGGANWLGFIGGQNY